MAITNRANIQEEIEIGTKHWAPLVAVSGSLALLLSIYLRDSLPVVHVSTTTFEHSWDIGTKIDHDCLAHEFLETIKECHQQNATLPNALRSFWLFTENPKTRATHPTSASGSETTPVPLQILCKIRQSKGGRISLILEVDEDDSLGNPRFLSQLAHITRQMLAAATQGQTLREIDVLCDTDRGDLQLWNIQPPVTISSTFNEMFAQRVLDSFKDQAVEAWDGVLTYAELDSRSSHLSSLLLEAGVKTGECIPLCFEKSVWVVVSMLAVLKTGCSFLLMDVSHPTSRLQTLSKEIGATIIISSTTQRDRASGLTPLVIVPSELSLSAPARGKHHQIDVSPSDVAVICFTSGTTGTPKGIQLEHTAICSMSTLADVCGITKDTRYYQFSSYAFDAAFGETLMTLMKGGVICIPSEADRLNRLAESMRDFKANNVLLTPTVLRLLSPSDVPCLTSLISGGERVTQDIVEKWDGHAKLVIVYGPAETTIACICKKAIITEDDAIRIGFPVNSRAWIALPDSPSQLAPVGAIGELVIEGPGIARNYINNRGDSSKLFLDTLPWTNKWESLNSIGRSYRTGDLARFTQDGEIIFLGRRDRQVKLRGQRIELEDIEGKLQQQCRIPGAHIVLDVLQVQSIDNLVAFLYDPSSPAAFEIDCKSFRLTEKLQLEIEGLRGRISNQLPAYMWPVAWIPLKKLPLSPTGKLDRRALARLGQEYYANLPTSSGNEDDLSPVEVTLAKMWRSVLQSATHSLSANAHFIQLGGDSLRSIKLVALATKEGYHLTMEKILRNPTISAMANAMQEIPADDDDEPVQDVNPATFMLQQDEVKKVWIVLEKYGLKREQIENMFPCTALQEGMFSLSLALPTLYSGQFVFHLDSHVDAQRLKTAWEKTVDSFSILRTAIVPSSSGLVQVVLKKSAEWTEVNQELAPFLATEKAAGFQSGQPLTRQFHVHDPASGQSHLVLALHHAVFDGWALETAIDRLRLNYYHPNETVMSKANFESFVKFCKDLNRDDCHRFWKQQLENAPTPSFPNLPKAGQLAADNSCLRHTMAIPKAINRATTLTVMARASWALLLAEYEGTDDVTFGNSLHGRNSLPSKLQNVVGPTVTTLPIRAKIDRDATVVSFLDGLQDQFSAMIPYEQYSLSCILAIDPEIRNSASFRTLLIVQVGDSAAAEKQGIHLEEVERSLHEYPLVLTVEPRNGQLEIIATFDDSIILPAQVERILEQFEQTYSQLSLVPAETRVRDIELASKADKATMFRWNARFHKAFEVCIHELIREQVNRNPTSQAVYSKEFNMDYATLDQLSDCIAGELRRSDVKPGSRVGVLFEKSPWAIVSILAVIKAGCAFAPLSPSNPQTRLEDISREANINTVLCSPTQAEAFPDPLWRPIVVSEETVGSFQHIAEPNKKLASPDSLLYILSTSGTTGTPKVFGVQHKCFATGAIARQPLLRRSFDSRVLQFAPFVFDPSVEDILATLMFGGCICVPSDDDIMGDISAFMQEAKVNFANITPSVAHTLKQDELPNFKYLLLSGEAPDLALIDKWENKVQLMNGYGPSECSVKCSINGNLTREDPRNIGHSVGTSVWVVKPSNHDLITPIGAVGELIIESPNLATGYMNRPDASKEKFITSPQWLREHRGGVESRIYKTGDLVRHMEDGSISYIGRGDMQLKLHGQRLEAEEVRQRIQEYLGEEDLQVLVDIARFEGQDSDVLVAYLAEKSASRSGSVDVDSTLQRHVMKLREQMVGALGQVLPKYMIPSVFLAITNIPVTPNGKADRRALKARIQRQRLDPQLLVSEDAAIEPPTTENEKIMHGLWQQLLGLKADQFGVNAHFFELGGSSLTAIRLAAAARDQGQSLSAQQIFRNPVLSAMAAQLQALKEVSGPAPAKLSLLSKIGRNASQLRKRLATYNIKEQDIEDAYPCTRQQTRYMEGEILSPGGTTHRHIMPLPAGMNLVKLETALKRVVRSNALLRTRIVSLSPHLVQVVMKDDFACRRFESMSSLTLADRKVSWGLGQPLSRFSIVSGRESTVSHLAWSSAHAVFDGWFRKLLLEDIDYAYHHNSSPPARPGFNRFIDHVYGQKLNEAGLRMMRELGDTQFGTYFTMDGNRAPRSTHTFSLGVSFPATLEAGVSYATVMLTAWAVVTAHVEEQNQLMVNVLLGGRDADLAGIDSVGGPTSTTTPLPTSIRPELSFRKNLELIQKRIDQASDIQHTVQLGDKLNRLMLSSPTVVVHPGEDYVESATKKLGLVRTRAETVQDLVDAMFMNFCLQTNNAGVDLLLAIDPSYFPMEKAYLYLGYLEQVLQRVFSAGGLDATIKDMDLGAGVPTSAISVTSSTEPGGQEALSMDDIMAGMP